MAAHVEGLAEAMNRGGHEVVVITRLTPDAARDTTVDGVRVLRADADMPWLPNDSLAHTASANHAFVSMLAPLGDWRPDIVHLPGAMPRAIKSLRSPSQMTVTASAFFTAQVSSARVSL